MASISYSGSTHSQSLNIRHFRDYFAKNFSSTVRTFTSLLGSWNYGASTSLIWFKIRYRYSSIEFQFLPTDNSENYYLAFPPFIPSVT